MSGEPVILPSDLNELVAVAFLVVNGVVHAPTASEHGDETLLGWVKRQIEPALFDNAAAFADALEPAEHGWLLLRMLGDFES